MTQSIILLCGPANAGKTTFKDNIFQESDCVISAEQAVISACKALDAPVSDFFNEHLNRETKEELLNLHDYIFNEMICRAQDVLTENENARVIIDSRNLKPSDRQKSLKPFKKFAAKRIAVNFKCRGYTQLIEKLNKERLSTGLSTPPNELYKMLNSFVPAIQEEGFDEVKELDLLGSL